MCIRDRYYTTHSSGLGIYIIPKKDYSKTYAIFGTRYGSVDSKFVVPGESELTEVPDGIAHYLEHKMFDQPDGSNVFDKFSKYGGNANAFTSFNITAVSYTHLDVYKRQAAPIVTEESIDKDKVFKAARYDKGTADYINCPMTKEEYTAFYNELITAETAPLKEFENQKVFEGCMPCLLYTSRCV